MSVNTRTILENKWEIAELAARYSRCLDGRRKESFLELFTEGGVWDFGPTFGAAQGRDQIERLFDMMMQLFTETRHLAGNVVVAVDGDSATGEVDAYVVAIDTTGREHATFASYDDVYAFDGGAWRIARRTVTMHTPPDFS